MNDARMTIRLPRELFNWYRKRAFDSNTSINHQVVIALQYRQDKAEAVEEVIKKWTKPKTK